MNHYYFNESQDLFDRTISGIWMILRLCYKGILLLPYIYGTGLFTSIFEGAGHHESAPSLIIIALGLYLLAYIMRATLLAWRLAIRIVWLLLIAALSFTLAHRMPALPGLSNFLPVQSNNPDNRNISTDVIFSLLLSSRFFSFGRSIK